MSHYVVFDIEVYPNYFLAAFKSLLNGKVMTFERREWTDFDRKKLLTIFKNYTTVAFNSRSYDLPITFLALSGASNEKLKQVSDEIIVRGLRPWEVERKYDLVIPKIDHIDLIEVAPGKASLKLYGGRLHSKRMQDLPFNPDAVLTEEEIEVLKDYCINDLDTTGDLFNSLKAQLQLRIDMSKEFGEDLKSKSDAQIAEAVIKGQIKKISGKAPERPNIRPGTSYYYKIPRFVRYEHEGLRAMLRQLEKTVFEVSDSGKVEMPKFLSDAKIEIGNGVYRMGIGGLHSSETCAAHLADDKNMLVDRDVTSYYPAIILNLGLAPKHIGPDFLKVYKEIVDRRIAAKRAGNTVVADSLKITINGSFGKFGSKWSTLYSPDLMTQTTLTGQLSLLLLIERMEAAGIPIVSANTDGLVIKCPRARKDVMDQVVKQWEEDTGFVTEDTEYAALYSRDVNNYIGVKPDGKTKRKGAYAPTTLMKNPRNEICVDAAIECLVKGTPVAETIHACKDIRKFVTVQQVQGGAVYRGDYLGKAIRWFYGLGRDDAIHYKRNGNKVPRSDGAVPMMEMPTEFPRDVNHWHYTKEAVGILRDVGFGGSADRHLDLL